MNQPRTHVVNALNEIIGHPQHSESRIAEYFSPDYQQFVDGKTLDYDQFVQHMALLKKLTRRMNIRFLAVVAEGNSVFTHHQVAIEKNNGACSETMVMAHFTLCGGKILRCDELTYQVSGQSEDKDLGSRL